MRILGDQVQIESLTGNTVGDNFCNFSLDEVYLVYSELLLTRRTGLYN